MRPDKNFRLSKETKRVLALADFPSKETRNAYKEQMIAAQMIAADASRKPLGRKEVSEDV